MWPVAPECGLLLLNVDSLVTGVCGQLVHVWVVVTFELWGSRHCVPVCVAWSYVPRFHFHSGFRMEIWTGYKATVWLLYSTYTLLPCSAWINSIITQHSTHYASSSGSIQKAIYSCNHTNTRTHTYVHTDTIKHTYRHATATDMQTHTNTTADIEK